MDDEAPFQFGSLTLAPDVQRRARQVCDALALSPSDLFIKWEAHAVKNGLASDTPTLADLDALQTSLRAKDAPAAATTPRSASKQRTSPVYKAPAAPQPLDIDDFFSYLPPEEQTRRTSQPDAGHISEDGDGVERSLHMDLDAAASDDDQKTSPTSASAEKSPRPKTVPAKPAVDAADAALALPGDDVADTAYAERAGSGRVEATFGTPSPSPSAAPQLSSLALTVMGGAPRGTHYMNDDLPGRVEALRARVRALSAAMAKRAELAGGDAGDADAFITPSPNATWVAGRVRVDADEVDGVAGAARINRASVVLESVDGARVRLALDRIFESHRPFFLAPGAVVVVQGVNTNGRSFDVHALLDDALPQSMSKKNEPEKQEPLNDKGAEKEGNADVEMQPQNGADEGKDKENKNESSNGDQASKEMEDIPVGDQQKTGEKDEPEDSTANVPKARVLVAAGPFTTSANLQYRPLDDLLDIVRREAPAVAVLLGPFVDSRHGVVSSPTLPATFEEVFERRVLSRVNAAATQLPGTNFVVVPSLEDVHGAFVAPQPPFDEPVSITLNPNVQLVPNPAVVEVRAAGGRVARVALSSLPAVADLASDCICWHVDRFLGIASHLIGQRSLYPISPPAPAVPVDTSLLEHLTIPSFGTRATADLLVAPSRIKPFVRCVEPHDALVVNPGRVCRGAGGGTYAEVELPLYTPDARRRADLNAKAAAVSIVRL